MQARVDWVLITFGTQVIKKTTGSTRVFRFLWPWLITLVLIGENSKRAMMNKFYDNEK